MARRTNIDHPTLGHLEYDKKHDWYSAKVSVDGQDAELNIHCHGAKGEPPALRHAVRLAEKLETLCRAVKERAVRDLLELKNNKWRHESEPELVVVYGDGYAEFCNLEGGLFWGHCILVRRDNRCRLQQAAIAG